MNKHAWQNTPSTANVHFDYAVYFGTSYMYFSSFLRVLYIGREYFYLIEKPQEKENYNQLIEKKEYSKNISIIPYIYHMITHLGILPIFSKNDFCFYPDIRCRGYVYSMINIVAIISGKHGGSTRYRLYRYL